MKGNAFGCYGKVEELSEEDVGQGEEILRQRPVRYNKNDPFGVNIRLRQSLSSTNRILFRQDNDRYVDNQSKILPKNSFQKLNQLKIVKIEKIKEIPTFDDKLYKNKKRVKFEEDR